jgi:hypothetical protein
MQYSAPPPPANVNGMHVSPLGHVPPHSGYVTPTSLQKVGMQSDR